MMVPPCGLVLFVLIPVRLYVLYISPQVSSVWPQCMCVPSGIVCSRVVGMHALPESGHSAPCTSTQ